MPTLDEALTYMGIDYADDAVKSNVGRALKAARSSLHGSVGEDVETLLPEDPRVKELILLYTDDLYSERGVSAKTAGSTRRLISAMELQLRMELRALREAGEAH